MTTVQELTSGIINDAHAQAARIAEETEREVMLYRQETEMLVAREQARLRAQVSREEALLLAREEAKRQLEVTQKTLTFKQELIDTAFNAAEHELEHLAPAKRRQLLKLLWQRASRQIAIGSVITNNHDAKFFKTRKKIESCGPGFIALSKDGKVRIDMRFTTLIEDIKTRKKAEIAKILFTDVKRKVVVKRKITKKKVVKRKTRR